MNTLLKFEWATHSEFAHAERPVILAEPDCICGRQERHRHCGVCGQVVSIGDWAAPPIAVIVLAKRKRRNGKASAE